MIRRPIVAGQFYPGSPSELEHEVRTYLAQAPKRTEPATGSTRLAMVPHAGYMYSGRVAGITLGQADLADTILLLGPNHTGMGTPFSVWHEGAWQTPIGAMRIDSALALALLRSDNRLLADHLGHVREHSLEVVIPFLNVLKGDFSGVPIAVAEHGLAALSGVAASMAGVFKSRGGKVSIVVSSDMSHYVTAEQACERDTMAIEAILRLDPVGLYSIVREAGISMCGVLPMTLGLMIALELGASTARLAAYATSGDATGDESSVVGYAGVLVE